jgi:hypothetical protein
MKDINKFEIALEKNEIDKFLLGEGFYFYNGGELGRYKHFVGHSWLDIVNYLKKNPNQTDFVYHLLDDTIVQILETKPNLSLINFLGLELFIWCYLIDSHEDAKIEKAWNISPKLRETIKKKIPYFREIKPDPGDEGLITVDYRNKLFKERFGFEW